MLHLLTTIGNTQLTNRVDIVAETKTKATIPISEIERAGEDMVYLKLDKHAIESLPAIPAGRWHGRKAA